MFRKARFSFVHLPGASSVMVSTCTANARGMFTSAPHSLRPSHQRSYEELLRNPRNSASATPTSVNGVAFSGTLCLKSVPSVRTAMTLSTATIDNCGSICFIMEPRHQNSMVHQLVLGRTIIGSFWRKKKKGSAILEHFRQFADLRRFSGVAFLYGKATFITVAPSKSGDHAPSALPSSSTFQMTLL